MPKNQEMNKLLNKNDIDKLNVFYLSMCILL